MSERQWVLTGFIREVVGEGPISDTCTLQFQSFSAGRSLSSDMIPVPDDVLPADLLSAIRGGPTADPRSSWVISGADFAFDLSLAVRFTRCHGRIDLFAYEQDGTGSLRDAFRQALGVRP
jgi:hypothetical protein